jgi:hypothetical protein
MAEVFTLLIFSLLPAHVKKAHQPQPPPISMIYEFGLGSYSKKGSFDDADVERLTVYAAQKLDGIAREYTCTLVHVVATFDDVPSALTDTNAFNITVHGHAEATAPGRVIVE